MGCLLSTPDAAVGARRRPRNIGEIVVFVPGLRIPRPLDFAQPLGDGISKSLVERLSALRTHRGGSTLTDLQQALEDYLPVLLGLVENVDMRFLFFVAAQSLLITFPFLICGLEQIFLFVMFSVSEETTMPDSRYEVLSVLHLMAVLLLSQANLLLLPNKSTGGYQNTSLEAGYLDFAVQKVLPQLPLELRNDLPLDLTEGVLKSLCLQALGQGVEIQLGMAIDSIKATLAVKRRLACEMVKYWHQAHEYIKDLPLANGWGEKHKLFVQWKHIEAKAAAYYLHGLILEEGNTSAGITAAALQAAEEYLKESKKACEAFHTALPSSRNPPLWGASKYLTEKIPNDTPSKKINSDSQRHELIKQVAPALPDFALSLKPDEYQLPSMDPSWNQV
ncbi:hypothetical protein V6N12_060473 [Hibiscus sabdariffa]|uniref:BRO1 domain-containing protein n=1 Tax=Hibiscus sabdariffa TaxID=183260 RepID=A0ABR2D4J1_9ROSI